jgi:integrase
MQNSFTIPKLSKSGNSWYIHFRFNGKQHRLKNNINRVVDLKQREIEFNILAKFTLQDLKNGWNPEQPEVKKEKSILTVIEAFNLALTVKKELLQNDTFINLRSKVNRFKKAIEALNYSSIKVVDLKIRHYEDILNKTSELFKLSDNAYNQYKVSLSNILNVLVDEKILKRSFKLKIKNKKVIKEVSHIPATHADIEKIKTHLKNKYPNYFLFWSTMFHTGIRPAELLKVKLSMIDLCKDCITIDKSISKNKTTRIVPINQYQKLIFKSMELDSFQNDYYLFGTYKEKYKAKKNIIKNYSPAPYKIERKEASDLWKLEIKENLNINMTLYSIKKYGANEKILAGLSVNALRELFGHSSEVTTQIYITNLQEINRKEILSKSPKF